MISHQSRGCKNKVCSNCRTTFHRIRDLTRHKKNNKNISCDHCLRTFCNNDHFQQHLRTIRELSDNTIPNINQPIIDRTGYDEYDGYKALIKSKINEISYRSRIYTNHKVINRQIDSSFTYKDIDDLITTIYRQQPKMHSK